MTTTGLRGRQGRTRLPAVSVPEPVFRPRPDFQGPPDGHKATVRLWALVIEAGTLWPCRVARPLRHGPEARGATSDTRSRP